MKRLLLTAGMGSLRGYLNRKPEPWKGMTRQEILGRMIVRFKEDSNRDDVGTGKCMHCIFRRDCTRVPNNCPFIDDRTPMHVISFAVYECAEEVVKYDCGWLVFPGGEKVSVKPADLGQYIRLTENSAIGKREPFSMGICLHRAVPRPGETFENYARRVNEAFDRLQESLENKDIPLEKKMRGIIRAAGKESDLKELYEDDMGFFVSDYWPGKTMQEVVNMYTNTENASDIDYLVKRRALENEVENA